MILISKAFPMFSLCLIALPGFSLEPKASHRSHKSLKLPQVLTGSIASLTDFSLHLKYPPMFSLQYNTFYSAHWGLKLSPGFHWYPMPSPRSQWSLRPSSGSHCGLKPSTGSQWCLQHSSKSLWSLRPSPLFLSGLWSFLQSSLGLRWCLGGPLGLTTFPMQSLGLKSLPSFSL